MRYTYVKRSDGVDFVFPENFDTLMTAINSFDVVAWFSFPAEKHENKNREAGFALLRARFLFKYKNILEAVEWGCAMSVESDEPDIKMSREWMSFCKNDEKISLQERQSEIAESIVCALLGYKNSEIDYNSIISEVARKCAVSKDTVRRINTGVRWQSVRSKLNIEPGIKIINPYKKRKSA